MIVQTGTARHVASLPDAHAPTLQAHLAGVGFTSPDIDRLSAFYSGPMGYRGRLVGERWVGELSDRFVTIEPGKGNALSYAAYTLRDDQELDRLTRRLGEHGIAFDAGWSDLGMTDGISLRDPDGNVLIFGIAKTKRNDERSEELPARLQHLVFASDDAQSMVRFYCDVIGFAPSDYVFDDQEDLTSAFLRSSQEHHSLAIFRAPRKRLDHLCYDVADWSRIRDWADRFAEDHVPLEWGPGRHGPGNNLFLFVNDPDGNWLEFSAELETVEGPRPIKLWAHEERTLNSWGKAIMRS